MGVGYFEAYLKEEAKNEAADVIAKQAKEQEAAERERKYKARMEAMVKRKTATAQTTEPTSRATYQRPKPNRSVLENEAPDRSVLD
jgi:hypothetical protein